MKGDSCEAVSGGNWSNERGPCLLSLFIGLLLRRMLRVAFGVEEGGGGVNNKFLYGEGGSAPRSNLLPFYIRFLTEKVPFVYLILTNGTLLHA